MTIRVLVVDDHPVFRAGLVAILDDPDDVEVVAQAGDGEQAIDAVASHRPDVVLMDLRMPGIGGLGATARITAHHPNTAVIVLTMDSDRDSSLAALQAGARGYLLKEADGDDVQRALHAVARGSSLRPRNRRTSDQFRSTNSGHRTRPIPATNPTRTRDPADDRARAGQRHHRPPPRTHRKKRPQPASDILTKLRARSCPEAVALARNAGLGGEPTTQS